MAKTSSRSIILNTARTQNSIRQERAGQSTRPLCHCARRPIRHLDTRGSSGPGQSGNTTPDIPARVNDTPDTPLPGSPTDPCGRWVPDSMGEGRRRGTDCRKDGRDCAVGRSLRLGAAIQPQSRPGYSSSACRPLNQCGQTQRLGLFQNQRGDILPSRVVPDMNHNGHPSVVTTCDGQPAPVHAADHVWVSHRCTSDACTNDSPASFYSDYETGQTGCSPRPRRTGHWGTYRSWGGHPPAPRAPCPP